MLSRTADHLYWLARYMERAESIARIMLATLRMASLARSLGSAGNEWHSTLIATGCDEGFLAKYGRLEGPEVADYLVRDPDNSSSIMSCLGTARRNGRAVRTALTSDMWNALNDTWLRARDGAGEALSGDRITGFLEWVRERSQLFSGAYSATMLRNDAFRFTRLGTMIERADNTARILDVRHHVLRPRDADLGGALDYDHWQAILRSVSALRAYHWVYHERLQPQLVAELLVLRPELPRSLRSCYDEITLQLDLIATAYGGRRGECHRLAGEMQARLRYGRIGEIFRTGLHEFLTDFIDRSIVLGNEISRFYLT